VRAAIRAWSSTVGEDHDAAEAWLTDWKSSDAVLPVFLELIASDNDPTTLFLCCVALRHLI
jgi:hypothetical protein